MWAGNQGGLLEFIIGLPKNNMIIFSFLIIIFEQTCLTSRKNCIIVSVFLLIVLEAEFFSGNKLQSNQCHIHLLEKKLLEAVKLGMYFFPEHSDFLVAVFGFTLFHMKCYIHGQFLLIFPRFNKRET